MSTNQQDELHLVEFLRTLWQFKFVVVFVTMAFAVAALYMALTATHIFRAEVVVTRVTGNNMSAGASLARQFGGLGGLASIGFGQDGPGQEAQAVLKSRNLTMEFFKRYKLLEEMSGDGPGPASLWQAVKDFRELYLRVNEDAATGLTTVSIEWRDPELVARWANAYVALANELLRNRALLQAESNIEYLRSEVENTNVVELERAIYSLLQTEIQSLMIANAREEYAFTVVDPAVVPEKRVKPGRTLIVVSGVALGVFCGVLAVFALSIIRQVRGTPTADAG